MPFVLPNFNLTCNLYTFEATTPGWPTIPLSGARVSGKACALMWGRKGGPPSTGGTEYEGVLLTAMYLLLPPLSDIRGLQDSVGQDVAEVPAGSGRWYSVNSVDDTSKGYGTEYRTAIIQALQGTWVAPYA